MQLKDLEKASKWTLHFVECTCFCTFFILFLYNQDFSCMFFVWLLCFLNSLWSNNYSVKHTKNLFHTSSSFSPNFSSVCLQIQKFSSTCISRTTFLQLKPHTPEFSEFMDSHRFCIYVYMVFKVKHFTAIKWFLTFNDND